MTSPNVQNQILSNLIYDEKFCRKTLPHLKSEYFDDQYKPIFETFLTFVSKYNKLPNEAALKIELEGSDLLTEGNIEAVSNALGEIHKPEAQVDEWLMDKTEKWCQDKAVFIAVMKAFEVISGKDEKTGVGAIPEILQKALSISFDTNIGHDYIIDAQERFDFYHNKENKLKFGNLDIMNKVTKGGIPNKILAICAASTGVGKSLFMCHCAADYLTQGHNVLYITMEMAEERIAERIDENLMDITMDDLHTLPKQMFDKKIESIKNKTNGKLIIKEYPTGSAHTGHFRALLNELKQKKNFIPQVIFIDYLNICASSKMKGLSSSVNTYSLIKSIAEELRSLAVEFNVPIWSATQTNRDAYENTDVDLSNISESTGLASTADLMFALVTSEQLQKLGQLMGIQLKNRFNDINSPKRFVMGVDRTKMKLYDVENNAQVTPPPSSNDFSFGGSPISGMKKSKFGDFKI